MHLIVLYICCGYLFLSYRCTGDYCFFVCFTENYVQITEIIMCAQY